MLINSDILNDSAASQQQRQSQSRDQQTADNEFCQRNINQQLVPSDPINDCNYSPSTRQQPAPHLEARGARSNDGPEFSGQQQATESDDIENSFKGGHTGEQLNQPNRQQHQQRAQFNLNELATPQTPPASFKSESVIGNERVVGQALLQPLDGTANEPTRQDRQSIEINHQVRESQLGAESEYVTIIHFNDCYNIEPGPKSSGAAGFLTAINEHRKDNPIILFSGDILSPSFMSTFTKGEQMIPVLNDIGVDCAVFGNHEFDYGVDNLIKFTEQTNFPWLLSNVVDKETNGQLGDGKLFHIIEQGGYKFGLIGLIEEEWLSTLSTLDSSDVLYSDFVERGRELARWLKGPNQRVDYVIALTHFRTPNDIRLADSVPEIDLILGGHDHDYEIIKRPNCYIIKSGTDFREFSLIRLEKNAQYLEIQRIDQSAASLAINRQAESKSNNKEPEISLKVGGSHGKPFNGIDIERIDCSSYPPDKNLGSKLEKFVTTIDEKMGQVLGQFNCELDGRFSSIRKYETNLGNFVTDIMLASTHADLAILNSGTLRSDRIHPRGDFTMRDLFNILGYIDPIAVLSATGEQIWRALENGVSQWPKLEGRFPQVSGCTFAFDPNKPPMERINPLDINIGEEQLILDKHYKLTTKAYLASGKDGYDALKECSTLVPGDESPDLTTSILNHFEAINIIKTNRRTHHRQSIICLSRSSIKKILEETGGQEGQSLTPVNSSNLIVDSLMAADSNNNASLCSTPHSFTRETCGRANNEANPMTPANLFSSSPVFVARNEGQETSYSSANANTENVHLPSAPASSSPLLGVSAPTPTLANMTASSVVECVGHTIRTPPSTIQRKTRTKRLMSLYEMENEQCRLEPKVEGRIRIYGVNV